MESIAQAGHATFRVSRGKAIASSARAPSSRALNQNWIAFSGELGVTKSGMPAYDSMCEKSSTPTPRKAQANNRAL